MKAAKMVFFWGVILALIPVGVCGAQVKEPIKIGVAFAFQGVWSDWCKRNVIALEMAIEEINAAGGVNGMPLRSVTYDTASKPDEATRIVLKLASDDKVLAILGPFSSSECEVAFPV